eukprot:14505150-Alexandrium_andersonii.AAC.1
MSGAYKEGPPIRILVIDSSTVSHMTAQLQDQSEDEARPRLYWQTICGCGCLRWRRWKTRGAMTR